MIKHIESQEQFDSLKKGDKPVLIDFYATWCGPCKVLSPILEQVADEIKEDAVIAKVDVDKMPAIAKAYGIMSVPTVYVFKAEQTIVSFSGLRTKGQIIEILRKA